MDVLMKNVFLFTLQGVGARYTGIHLHLHWVHCSCCKVIWSPHSGCRLSKDLMFSSFNIAS